MPSIFSVVRLGGLLFLFGSLALLGGCSKKKSDQTAGSTGDYVTGTPLPERQEGTSFFSGNVERNQFQPIYFDFDSQTIRTSENGKIQQVASFLQQNNSQIIIAGFTDERGTAEYNRGLGERRAQSVREALIAMRRRWAEVSRPLASERKCRPIPPPTKKPGRRIAGPKSAS